jgi:hypothetical protein
MLGHIILTLIVRVFFKRRDQLRMFQTLGIKRAICVNIRTTSVFPI